MSPARMDMKNAGRAVRPLRFIFWGVPFGLFTYPAWSDATFLVLLVGDVVGTVVMMAGASSFAAIDVGKPYATAMRSAWGILAVKLAALLVILAVSILAPARVIRWEDRALFIYPFQLGCLTATIVICYALRRLCDELDLVSAWHGWTTTLYLAVIFHMAPPVLRTVHLAVNLKQWLSDSVVSAIMWAPVPLSLIAIASIMYSTRNTIETIMLFEREDQRGGG